MRAVTHRVARCRRSAALLVVALACSPAGDEPLESPPEDAVEATLADDAPRPNILWIVWDTVRADHMSLYGHPRPTTPKLEAWAKRARVFDDAIAASNSTVPSHASMFTGLLPSEHGAHSGYRWLDDAHDTVAELLRAAGYQTYLFAANPHIAKEENFTQGFDVAEHPWSPDFRERATKIVLAKIRPDDVSSELSQLAPRVGRLNRWGSKASGELAREGLERWLAGTDPNRPWFAFLNYMEAHRPFLPSEEQRARMMPPADVERSYRIDRSWRSLWSYAFGLGEYEPHELEVMAATYDATLAELDELFAALVASGEEKGWLRDTVVVLVADHGEHLGDHHLLDHQYSLYQGLVHVPLVVYAPGRLEPGRDPRPAMNLDLFPTTLELAGVEDPRGRNGHARSLLGPATARVRLAEYPSATPEPLDMVAKLHPEFDRAPWERSLRALYTGQRKFIWASDGRSELYDLADDPAEAHDLAAEQPQRVAELERTLAEQVDDLAIWASPTSHPPVPDGSRRRLLEALGYLAPENPSEAP